MNLLNDLTLQAIFSRIFGTLMFLAVSGGVYTLVAQSLRRPDAEYDFSFSANPLTHLSMPALAMAILFRTSWMRHLPVSPETLRGGRWALVTIVAVTAMAGFALVVSLDFLRPVAVDVLPRTLGYAALQLIQATQQISLSSVPLSVLPLPGLPGGLLLLAVFPHKERQFRRAVAPVYAALVIMLVLGWWPDFAGALAPWFTRG